MTFMPGKSGNSLSHFEVPNIQIGGATYANQATHRHIERKKTWTISLGRSQRWMSASL